MTTDSIIKDNIRQRKFQAFAIESDSLVEFFQISEEGHIRLPLFENLPNDALLWRAYHDPESDSFVFLFLHESFRSVPVGSRPLVRPASYRVVELLPAEGTEAAYKEMIRPDTMAEVKTKVEQLRKNVKSDKDS